MTANIGTGTFGHRVNISAELPDPICMEKFFDEVIVGVNGQYLGSFNSLYLVPFGLEYPVGWTHGTWVEQPGIAFSGDPSCTCVDCEGSHFGIRVHQQLPDENIGCDDASVFDYYDYTIMPDHYTGLEGCLEKFYPTRFCGGAPGGNCDNDISLEAWKHEPWPWPLVPFAFANASSRIRVVEDTSGPEGCEDVLALEVDFSGAGNEGVSFVGEGGGYDGASDPQTGVSNADRSTTGWTVEDGSCWIEKFWIKAVPDNDGYVCSDDDYTIITRAGLYPFPFARVHAGGDPGPLILNGDWQEWYWVWTANYGAHTPNPLLNAMWGIFTTIINPFEPDPPDPTCNLPRFARKGRVHIKQPHLAACVTSDGVIIKRPSGMGT